MREYPMPYSTDMVIANLEDRKNNTRRTKGLKNINERPDDWEFLRMAVLDGELHAIFHHKLGMITKIKSPYGQKGDLIWCKEAALPDFPKDFEYYDWTWKEVPEEYRDPKYCLYKASWNGHHDLQWKPPMFMPKWAARIWQMVEEVRIERVQDITEEDARNEGVKPVMCQYPGDEWSTGYMSYREGFKKIWIELHGEESWRRNDWVWVVRYKTISKIGRPNI